MVQSFDANTHEVDFFVRPRKGFNNHEAIVGVNKKGEIIPMLGFLLAHERDGVSPKEIMEMKIFPDEESEKNRRHQEDVLLFQFADGTNPDCETEEQLNNFKPVPLARSASSMRNTLFKHYNLSEDEVSEDEFFLIKFVPHYTNQKSGLWLETQIMGQVYDNATGKMKAV